MNSPHKHERQHQAEKHGQATLSQFGESIKVIEQGNRNRAEASKQQGRSYHYIDKHPIQSAGTGRRR